MIRNRLLSLVLIVTAASSAGGQSLPGFPRITPTTGLADSSLYYCTDSTKTLTRACKFSDIQKRLAYKAFDSLAAAGLRISGTATFTGATIVGTPTWSSVQTFASGQLVDSAVGSARAQRLTTARTIGGTSFDGTGNIVPGLSDSATGATRAQKLTTARTINGVSFDGTADISVPGSIVTDTIRQVTFDSVRATRVRADTVSASAGVSKPLTLQSWTSAGTRKNTLVLGADTSATFLGKITIPVDASGTGGIVVNGDPNTNIYSSAADTWIVNAGGQAFTFGTSTLSLSTASLRAANGSTGGSGVGFVNGVNSGLRLGNNGSNDTLVTQANGIQTHLNDGVRDSVPIRAVFTGDTIRTTSQIRATALPATGAGDVNLCQTTTGVFSHGATCGTSSSKLKHGFTPITNPTAKFLALHPLTYSYRPGYYGGRTEFGLLADEVAKVDRRLAFYSDRDQPLTTGDTIHKGEPQNVNDRAVLGLTVATVQELIARVDRLEKTTDSLRTALAKLQKDKADSGMGGDVILLDLGIYPRMPYYSGNLKSLKLSSDTLTFSARDTIRTILTINPAADTIRYDGRIYLPTKRP